MKVLVACEESQSVTKEFRALGHEAYSCDVLETSGDNPEWHLHEDVIPLRNKGWDLIIAFPPCTHLAVSGAAWFAAKRADGRQKAAIDFFMALAASDCPKIAIENPVSIMSSEWRKPDQIIHPWQFGDSYRKRTCLWLKGLPKLEPTNVVDPGETITYASGCVMPKWYAESWNLKPKDRARMRSKTFPGIAKAMATQWGGVNNL